MYTAKESRYEKMSYNRCGASGLLRSEERRVGKECRL